MLEFENRMRRILILILILGVCAALLMALWIFRGREISSFIDRYWTVETGAAAIRSITYQGSGTGGILVINGVSLSLHEAAPGLSLTVGSTKDNQLALASSGKVFPFGPLKTDSENTGDPLAASPAEGDQALITARRGVVSWPTPFEFNPMTGHSPSWKRHMYYDVRWKKTSGANLRMLWRYQQFFYPGNGWTSGVTTREGATGLIRVEIKE
jgi:hypothetical protein